MPRKFLPSAPISVEREAEISVMGLAVNLADLDRVPPFIRASMLGSKLDLGSAVRVDPERVDETAVAFSCDLLTAGAVLDVLRANDRKAGDYPTRAYVRRKAWSRLPGTAMLTIIRDGKLVLNPELFGTSGMMEEAEPPPVIASF